MTKHQTHYIDLFTGDDDDELDLDHTAPNLEDAITLAQQYSADLEDTIPGHILGIWNQEFELVAALHEGQLLSVQDGKIIIPPEE